MKEMMELIERAVDVIATVVLIYFAILIVHVGLAVAVWTWLRII